MTSRKSHVIYYMYMYVVSEMDSWCVLVNWVHVHVSHLYIQACIHTCQHWFRFSLTSSNKTASLNPFNSDFLASYMGNCISSGTVLSIVHGVWANQRRRRDNILYRARCDS